VRSAILLLALGACLAGCSSSPEPPTAGIPGALATLPALVVPRFTITHPADRAAPGFVFVAEKSGRNQLGGPAIVDDKGRVLWYHQVPVGLEATDFRTQTYRGRPVLTWWQGVIATAGFGTGVGEIYDASYRRIAEVRAVNGLSADLHEFQLTSRGTALITAYKEVPADLSGIGGPKQSYALDSIVQEIDIATGKLVFQWSSLAHVPLSDSKQANAEPAHNASKRRPFDYFHINAVSEGPNDTLLISARNTSTIYLISHRDGHIVWRIGTAGSDFGPADAVDMHYQHDARLHPGSLLSFFDNGGIPEEVPFSRPTVLKLDVAAKTAHVLKRYIHPDRIASPYEGSLQLLPGGDALVGWGGVPKVTEFGPGNGVRFELQFVTGDTYRAYRLAWHGDPGGAPAVAMRGHRVFASWNGKLGVAYWRVLVGADANDLRPTAETTWGGLETGIELPQRPRAVAVEALDQTGRVLGRSPVLVLQG
jgi:hypothetical protein